METAEEARHGLLHHGVIGNQVDKVLLLFAVGQLPVQQQVAGFQIIGMLRQLVDGVAAMQQYTVFTVDEGDFRFTGGSGNKTRVVGEVTFAGQSAHIDDVGAGGA